MLVSVVIPTHNSARTIRQCICSALNQTHHEIEVIVVDSLSSDATPEIARKLTTVISRDSSIPRARYEGALAASGEFVMNLDSDQILEPTAMARALDSGRDMVAFGESSGCRGVIASINRLDQRLTEVRWADNLDPVRSPIRPRCYRRGLLIQALERIPERLLDVKPSPFSEDSLIYYHASQYESGVGFVSRGITHLEDQSIYAYERKWFGYGRCARAYRGTAYEQFATRRGLRRGSIKVRVGCAPALLIKGLPFFLGYHM